MYMAPLVLSMSLKRNAFLSDEDITEFSSNTTWLSYVVFEEYFLNSLFTMLSVLKEKEISLKRKSIV